MIRLWIILVVLATAAPAHADDDEPWARGVSAEQQATANAQFAEGNALFAQRAHGPALEKYRSAVAVWDHPMIRFNMAVTLIRLDRMLEAGDELDKALRFGAQPFTPELYEQALDYQRLVSKQLGYVEVSCDQPGTHVQLDGKPWFAAPGTRKVRVTSGAHVLIAEREGHITVSRRLVVVGGSTVTEMLALEPIERALLVKYRYPRWRPWATAGSGAAVTLGGLGIWLAGRNQMDRFASQFVRDCPTGCESDLAAHPELADLRDGAQLKGKIGVSMMIIGGVITAGGVTWAILNRPQRYVPQLEVIPSSGGMTAYAAWQF